MSLSFCKIYSTVNNISSAYARCIILESQCFSFIITESVKQSRRLKGVQ